MANAKREYFGIKYEGAKEILTMLKGMGNAAQDILTQAAQAGARIVLEESKSLTPVSEDGSHGGRPGALRDSIEMKQVRIRTRKYARTFKLLAEFTVGPRYSRLGKAGGVNYGHLVELGHKSMAGKRVQGENPPGRPYLRQAVDRNKRQIAEAINKVIYNALGRAMH